MDKRTAASIALMMDFAQRTGLSSGRPAKRYLWTDAFAVLALPFRQPADPPGTSVIGAIPAQGVMHLIDQAQGEHRDINEVMLATSLRPTGCSCLDSPNEARSLQGAVLMRRASCPPQACTAISDW